MKSRGLVLLGGRRIEAEDVAKMFRLLLGREPNVSAGELARVNRELEARYAELEDEGGRKKEKL